MFAHAQNERTSDVKSSSFVRKLAAMYKGNSPLDVSLIFMSMLHTDLDMVTVGSIDSVPCTGSEPLSLGKGCADAMLTTKRIMIILKGIENVNNE